MVSSPKPAAAQQPEEPQPPEPSSPAVPSRKGEVIDGRYRILGLLGEGNSGTTHRAQRIKDGVIVALKEVSLQGAQSWKLIELFEREVAMLKQLDHPAIPRYIDSFVVDSHQDRRYYLAQTLAEGKTLTDWIEGGWRCTEAEAQEVATQLLEILSYLQRCDPPIIHRDIKPLNIIRRDDGKIFLVDFGAVGHTYHNTFMRGSTVVGTFGYMAPEQFRGQACTATDLYSLGATLLYLLTRRSPADLPAQQLKVDFRSKVLLSDSFADWLGQLIEPSLRHRFNSANVALTTLQRLQQDASQDQGLLKPALKILGGLSILGLVALVVINQYKYSVLKHLGSGQELQAAIAAGDIPVAEYLNRGGDISLAIDQGQTLLIFAIQQGDETSITQLINRGVSPSLANRNGETALHVAAKQKNLKLLELLLAQPTDLNVRDRKGNAPLHVSATAENALVLLKTGAKATQLNRDGKSILQTAVERGWHPVIHQYFEITKKIPKTVPENPSLIAIAAAQNDVRAVKLLKWGGARFTYKGEGSQLSYQAIRRKHWELGVVLLEMGAEININHVNSIKSLVSKGQQPDDPAFTQLSRLVQKQERSLRFEQERKRLLVEMKEDEARRKLEQREWKEKWDREQRMKEWNR